MPSLRLRPGVIWLLAAFITSSFAQTSRLFQWKFVDNGLSTYLPTCYPLSIVVESFNTTANNTIGTPPYYMIAFVVGGTPVTTFIGTDENNLNWTVTEPVGSRLMLSVVDANGSAGGIQPRMFTVIAGSGKQCITTPSLVPAFSITSNVTGDLQTCQPWGFAVKGGVPPYTITFAQLDSTAVTNFSMPFGDDSFTFINRADPNAQLIGAVSDMTGRWATGTPIVNTKGSSDTSCGGLLSSSGNATLVQQAAYAPNSTLSGPKKMPSVAIGVSIAILLLFLLATGIGASTYLRRRRRQNQEFLSATLPCQFVEVEAQPPFVPNEPSLPTYQQVYMWMSEREVTIPPQSHHRSFPSPDNSSSAGISYYHNAVASDRQTSTTVSRPLPSMRIPQRGFTNFPSTSTRCSPKSMEAQIQLAASPDSEYVLETAISDSSDVLGRQLSAISSTRTGLIGVGRVLRTQGRVDEESEMMDQHQDADSIRGPPPPYADSSDSDQSTW